MNRIKFEKGAQRRFLNEVLKKINCPNLRSLNQFGFEVPYSTLKNYFNELRTLPEELFNNLCYLSKIEPSSFKIVVLPSIWGQVIGGKRGRKKGRRKRLNTLNS